MRKNTYNFLIDLVSLLVMIAMICTGLVMRYTLPPGSGGRGGGQGLFLWGLNRHDWGSIHFWLSSALVVLLLVHLVMHWSWVCNTIRCWIRPASKVSYRAKNLYGAGFFTALVLLVGAFFWLTQRHVEVTMGDRLHQDSPTAECASSPKMDEHKDHAIRGFMTLEEVAGQAGMSVEELKALLHLPSHTPANERLGRLRRRYGVDMSTVRRIVTARAAR